MKPKNSSNYLLCNLAGWFQLKFILCLSHADASPQLERHLFAAATSCGGKMDASEFKKARWSYLRDELHHQVGDGLTH